MSVVLVQRRDAVEFQVKVVPGASRTRVCGVLGGALKVAVAAQAEKGKANEAVIVLLAAALSTRPADIAIAAGHTRPLKTVRVSGVALNVVGARLARAVAASPAHRSA